MLKEHYNQRQAGFFFFWQAGLVGILQKRWAREAFNLILPTHDNLEK